MRAVGLGLLVAGLLGGPACTPALAKLNPFGDASKTKLSNADDKVLDQATQRLLSRPDFAPVSGKAGPIRRPDRPAH